VVDDSVGLAEGQIYGLGQSFNTHRLVEQQVHGFDRCVAVSALGAFLLDGLFGHG